MGSIAEVNLSVPKEIYTVARNDLLKPKNKTISPLIFTKAKPTKTQKTLISSRLHVFENLLSLVVQAYYKSDVAIEAICPEMKIDEIKASEFKGRKTKDIRRRAIKKQNRPKPRAEQETPKQENGDSSNGKLIEDRNLLDYLISPLKADSEFGQLIRELVN